MSNADVTLYAQWAANKYTVTYAPGTQGTFSPDVTTGLNYGDTTPVAPATPGNPGYTFTGWLPVVSPTVTRTITYVAQWTVNDNPSLTVEKSANKEFFSTVGETITYSYKVTNTGNVTISGPFTIVDDKIGTIDMTSAPASLAVGATFTVTANYVVTQADMDAGFVTNLVKVTGTFDDEDVPGEDEVTVPVDEQTPELTIEKSADKSTFSTVGEKITYTYLVTNKGNVVISGPFKVVDDKIGTIDTSTAPTSLAPGETFTVAAVYEVTQADRNAGFVTNVVEVTGSFEDEDVTGEDTVTVDQKSSGGGGGGGGGTVTIREPIPEALPELNKEDHFQYIQGYPNNTVRPEGRVTREEVAAVFYRLLANNYRDSIKTLVQGFNDVNATRWSTKHIATLANGKIVEGYPDGSFRPGNFITRAELATIASRFDNLSPFESNSFSDIDGHWANKYINSSAKKGWVNGYPDGSFKPDQYITRAEFVTLVNNVLERRVHKENILENARAFPDLLESKWYYEAMQEAINSHLYIRLEDTFEQWEEIVYPQLDM